MGTAFGIGLPGASYPVQASPWGLTSSASQGIGAYSPYSQPLVQPLTQILLSLQSTSYQLQQLLQLEHLQLQQVQQLLQVVPAQLQQLQQLIQFIPYQLQQQQQLHAQPFGQSIPGLGVPSPFMGSPIGVPFTSPATVM